MGPPSLLCLCLLAAPAPAPDYFLEGRPLKVWLEELTGQNVETRRKAAEKLHLNAVTLPVGALPQTLPVLDRALKDGDLEVRKSVVFALNLLSGRSTSPLP